MLRQLYSLIAAGAAVSLTPPAPGLEGNSTWVRAEEPAKRLTVKGLPMFGRLNEHVWRSGQPTAHGYQELKKMGVKTIINLRGEYPGDRQLIPKDVRYVYLPIKDRRPPTDRQANQLLQIVSDSKNWPVLIHCEAGESRTGMMSAVIRYSLDGWDDERIMEEVNNFRVAHAGFVKLPLRGAERRFIQQWELKNHPGGYLTENATHL